MPVKASVAAICNHTTLSANFFSLASASKSAAMIAAFIGCVKRSCGSSPASLFNFATLLEFVQQFVQLVVAHIFDHKFAAPLGARLDFHMSTETCAHFFLQALGIAADLGGGFLWLGGLFRILCLLLHQLFRLADGKAIQDDLV